MKTNKVLFSSLYLLLEAESVEKLDNFWREYTEGVFVEEFQQKLFPRGSDFTVNVTEENYTQYRKFLGMCLVRNCLSSSVCIIP